MNGNSEQTFREDLGKLRDTMRRDLAAGDFEVVFARYTAGSSNAERAYATIVNQAAGRKVSVAWLLERLETI